VESTLAGRLARRRTNARVHAFGGPRLGLFVVVGFERVHFIFEFLAQQFHVEGWAPEARIGEGAKFQQAQVFGFMARGQPFFLELEALANADQQERDGRDAGFRPGKGYLTGPKDEFEYGYENGSRATENRGDGNKLLPFLLIEGLLVAAGERLMNRVLH
jgi:hypothetical protein